MRRILGVLALALPALCGPAAAQEAKKPAVIKILVPDAPTVVELKIEGQPTKQGGPERVFVTPELEPGKNYSYSVEALIIPNNYTRITRSREVKFKAGEAVTLDLRQADPKVRDEIVVRWVPTPGDIVDKMCEMAKVGKNDVVYDLGCGDAVMLIRAVKIFNAKKGVGIDIDPKYVKIAKDKAAEAGIADKIDVKVGDILDVKTTADADVVLLYIGDDLGKALGPVLRKSLKPGSRVVSHRFTLGDWKPAKSVTVKGKDGDEYELHYWVVE